jgi:hypothetical protein
MSKAQLVAGLFMSVRPPAFFPAGMDAGSAPFDSARFFDLSSAICLGKHLEKHLVMRLLSN